MRALLVALLVVGLAGCGFQLRGARALPDGYEAVYVRGPSLIRDAVAIELESSGARVPAERGEADAVISIADERFDRRVLSVDARTGKEREIELVYVASFLMSRGDGGRIGGTEKVTLLRDYVLDVDAVLGKSREEGVLKREMRRDAAQQILRRLEIALR